MESNISKLKAAIEDKIPPLKVAHTRLANRSQRPNIELTRDPAHSQLVNEVTLIEDSIAVSVHCLPPVFNTSLHVLTLPHFLETGEAAGGIRV